METKKYLDALEKMISKRYSHQMYCIGNYQEAAICIQIDADGWLVYNGERGNKYNEIKCDTVLKACLEFIRKFTHNAEDISAMEDELIMLLNEAA